MRITAEQALTKVPEVTLVFWLIKIAATTLGETGGDVVSMSMNLGYLVGTAIFALVFMAAVIFQIRAKGFHPSPPVLCLCDNHIDMAPQQSSFQSQYDHFSIKRFR